MFSLTIFSTVALIGDRNMECADIAAALDQGDDWALVRGAGLAAFGERPSAVVLVRALAFSIGP